MFGLVLCAVRLKCARLVPRLSQIAPAYRTLLALSGIAKSQPFDCHGLQGLS